MKKLFGCVLTAMCFVAGTAWAVADWSKLPDTGQTKCYNASSEIPCPAEGQALFGQDAQYNINPRSLTNNGDGTVTDSNTKLIWQRADDGDTRHWQSAINYCGKLILAGRDDWRLPEILELKTLVNHGTSAPVIDTAVFPTRWPRWSSYWSATSYAADSGRAWRVDFNGGIGFNSKKDDGEHYVRCVRGGL